MIPNELTSIEQRIQQKWHDLVMAEQQGASVQVLEHMYNAYIVTVEEYNRCLAATNSTRQAAIPAIDKSQVYSAQQPIRTISALPQPAAPNTSQKRKKAS